MDYDVNAHIFNLTSEKDIAVLLSHFNSSYIFDVINNSISQIRQGMGLLSVPGPNVIAAFEQNFNYLKTAYPLDVDNTNAVRDQTYKEIIEMLCNAYNLEFDETQVSDYYSAAFYLYDFLVCNFNSYIVSFFSNIIRKEKNQIYEALGMDQFKNSKDISTIYNKKMYIEKDNKLAIISSNLSYVIRNMLAFDYNFDFLISMAYGSGMTNITDYIIRIVKPINDFYKIIYGSAINNQDAFPLFITSIRLDIQRNIETNTIENINTGIGDGTNE